MKRKKAVSLLCLILAVLMVLSLVISVLPVRAYAVSQSDIDALKEKKNQITQRVTEAKDSLERYQAEEADVMHQKGALEEKNAAAQEALEVVNEEIALYNELIAQKEQELQKAITREQDQLSRYRTRIRAMEESGGYNLMGILIHSGSFSELLTALDDMGNIMESDKALEHEYREAREDVERVKADYEQTRAESEERKAELEEEKAGIEAEIAETEAMLEALADRIAEAEALYDQELAAEAEASREVEALIAKYNEEQARIRAAAEAEARRRAEEAARNAAQQGGNTGGGSNGGSGGGGGESVSDGSGSTGGSVSEGGSSSGGGESVSGGGSSGGGGGGSYGITTWPAPTWNGWITGRYGESRPGHFHAGIDIDGYGCDGAAIVAAGSGTVIFSGYSSGYGNYVMIDHGGGYVTLYAHMSGNAVSEGQWVSAGQCVGYMGATGNASGTHLHFEIRINGSTVDPAGWFPGYMKYYNC